MDSNDSYYALQQCVVCPSTIAYSRTVKHFGGGAALREGWSCSRPLLREALPTPAAQRFTLLTTEVEPAWNGGSRSWPPGVANGIESGEVGRAASVTPIEPLLAACASPKRRGWRRAARGGWSLPLPLPDARPRMSAASGSPQRSAMSPGHEGAASGGAAPASPLRGGVGARRGSIGAQTSAGPSGSGASSRRKDAFVCGPSGPLASRGLPREAPDRTRSCAYQS
jgi:hypothetical protein